MKCFCLFMLNFLEFKTFLFVFFQKLKTYQMVTNEFMTLPGLHKLGGERERVRRWGEKQRESLAENFQFLSGNEMRK